MESLKIHDENLKAIRHDHGEVMEALISGRIDEDARQYLMENMARPFSRYGSFEMETE